MFFNHTNKESKAILITNLFNNLLHRKKKLRQISRKNSFNKIKGNPKQHL